MFAEERVFVLTLAEKLKLLFDYDFPGTGGFRIQGVWGAGDLLNAYGGNFNKFVLGHRLQTQEGIVFRHLLRLVLLMGEFKSLTPPECDPQDWQLWLDDTAAKITESCRQVDPTSTEMTLAKQDDG